MKRSYWIAGGLAVISLFWLLSGTLVGETPEAHAARPAASETLTRVQAALFLAEPVTREIVLHGHTEARRTVLLKAETAGTVIAVPLARGAAAQRDAVIARLAEEDRGERLAQAKALVRQRELEYEGTLQLKRQNLNAEQQVAEALALLESARADLKGARLNLERAVIRAPFVGMLQERAVEVGDYLGIGDPVATLVELDPLRATGDVSEQQVAELHPGMRGSVSLTDGRSFPATVTYVAPAAAASTRTFRVEVELSNPDGRVPAGMTAELRIPLGEVHGHRLSAGLLALDDAGRVGVKRVDEEGRVFFDPVEVLKSRADAVWVDGLPERARLITAGQGFVRAGDRVEVVEAGS